jgi:hypothetical protein
VLEIGAGSGFATALLAALTQPQHELRPFARLPVGSREDQRLRLSRKRLRSGRARPRR